VFIFSQIWNIQYHLYFCRMFCVYSLTNYLNYIKVIRNMWAIAWYIIQYKIVISTKHHNDNVKQLLGLKDSVHWFTGPCCMILCIILLQCGIIVLPVRLVFIIIGVRVMVFKATFNNMSVYIVAVRFIGGGNRSTQRKPTDLPQITDKFYYSINEWVFSYWSC